MDKEIIENLEKNDYLKGKLSVIEKLVDKKDYKEAYYKLAVILEYINIKYIKAKFNLDMKDSSVMNIIDTYRNKDEELFKDMIIINCEYNDVNMDNVEKEDVEYLASIVDLIYKQMIENIGEFIK